MTNGKWVYQKAAGHHHVLIGNEVLDVQNESDARLIALVPDLVDWVLQENHAALRINLLQLLKKIEKAKRA